MPVPTDSGISLPYRHGKIRNGSRALNYFSSQLEFPSVVRSIGIVVQKSREHKVG